MTITVGLILGVVIGAGCRWFDIPVPSPPKLAGAFLVLSMTLGYLAADNFLAKAPNPTVREKVDAKPQ